PFVDDLGRQLAAFRVDAICGPLLGGAFVAQLIANVLDCEAYFTRRAPDANGTELYAARYELPAAFRSRVAGKRMAIVDDVISAGSSLRATFEELSTNGAVPVVA